MPEQLLPRSTITSLRAVGRVLRRCPTRRLLLPAKEGSHRQKVLDLLTSEGIDPGGSNSSAMLPDRSIWQLYHRIDIGLDTFPYNGHTTSLRFLLDGRAGRDAGRADGGRACGLTIIDQPRSAGIGRRAIAEEYVQIAADLAGDLPRLAELRRTLRQRMRAFAADGRAAIRAEHRGRVSADVAEVVCDHRCQADSMRQAEANHG